MNEKDQREAIAAALADFQTKSLPAADTEFFDTLGYASDRTTPVGSVEAFCSPGHTVATTP